MPLTTTHPLQTLPQLQDRRLKQFGKQHPRQTQNKDSDEQASSDIESKYLSVVAVDAAASTNAAERRAGALTAALKGGAPLARGTLPLPPYAIGENEWIEARRTVQIRHSLSSIEQYVFLRLLGYEGLSPNQLNGSVGGLLQSTLDGEIVEGGSKFWEIVESVRALEGKTSDLGTDGNSKTVGAYTLDEILDAQRIYAIRYLDNQTTAEGIRESNILNELGSPEMVAQLVDTIYRHGSDAGAGLIQNAINDVVATLPDKELHRLGLETLAIDKNVGVLTRRSLRILTNGPLQDEFMLALQKWRTRQLIEDGEYTGNDRKRVWGLS